MTRRIWYKPPGTLHGWCEAYYGDLDFLRRVCRPGTLFALEREQRDGRGPLTRTFDKIFSDLGIPVA